MGLRFRLNCLLAGIFLLAFVVAVAIALHNARRAVMAELRASTEIASTLITALNAADLDVDKAVLSQSLAGLQDPTPLRHLRIAAAPPVTATIDKPSAERDAVPAWFYHLAVPDPGELTRTFAARDGEFFLIADPTAEIAEAWREVRGTLTLLVLAFCAAMVVVMVALGRLLRPLASLAAALEGVGKGHYSARLPASGVSDIDQINERFNQMVATLENSESNNAALARRALVIEERERRHLAHELHDEMGQSITAIKALAVSIRERATGELAERAVTIMDVSSSIYERVRHMMTRLHPVVLDELGLVAALRQMIDEWNTHHPASFCRFNVNENRMDLDEQIRIGVFRVVQEALTNVARHAGAEEVTVTLEHDEAEGVLSLDIVDNGCGFALTDVRSGLGLRGIRERIDALGGRLDINTAVGAGVRIAATIPLPGRKQHERNDADPAG